MKINDINIKNFKGIENIDLIFDEQFNVLIGENGAGKSSILDAISIGLGTFLMNTTASFGLKGTKSRPLLKDEIRKVIVSDNNIELSDVELSGTFCINSIDTCIPWKREQKIGAKNLTVRDAYELKRYGRNIIEGLHTNLDFPLFANHTTGRLWGQIYEKSKTEKKIEYEKTGSRLDGYYACLDPRSIDQKFLNWFKTYEDSILKFNKDRALYDAFTGAITSMVKDWNEIHFHWGLDDILGKNEEGKWVQLRNLSDGYKGIISLTADIAYRAIKLNPHLGERAVLDTEGIVLIDELDMHLHPKWQRHIVEDLKRTFPRIQFIVTTHSPFIVQSLKAEEVINLDENELSEDPDVMTIEENALFMGVSDDNSDKFERKEKLATEYLSLLDVKNPSEEALGKLEALLVEFSDDPAFVAKLKLEKLIKIGK
ncbi:AAA family ATPase [Flavobacterium psychrophilum]|nr:AAA family ATPase [Flavobacterium psychrophilum]